MRHLLQCCTGPGAGHPRLLPGSACPLWDVCPAPRTQTEPPRASLTEPGEMGEQSWLGRRGARRAPAVPAAGGAALVRALIAFLISGATEHGDGRLGRDGDSGLLRGARGAAGTAVGGSGAAARAGGRRRGRGAFRRGLTLQRGLLRLAAFPGVCIFMLIGSLRCVCC